MARIDCPREDDVLLMVSTGRWPSGAPAELREHATDCQVCAELGAAAAAIGVEAAGPAPALPTAGTVWWRAQLRARQDAAAKVARPITAAQMLALAALVGAAGAVFGATTEWFQRSLRSVGRVVSGNLGSLSLPSLPSLPQDLSSVPASVWIVLLVAGLGVLAGVAVFTWAMKEE
jgi:hypothetical protein